MKKELSPEEQATLIRRMNRRKQMEEECCGSEMEEECCESEGESSLREEAQNQINTLIPWLLNDGVAQFKNCILGVSYDSKNGGYYNISEPLNVRGGPFASEEAAYEAGMGEFKILLRKYLAKGWQQI